MCEDGGFLWDVAALTRTKAHHTVDLPGTISHWAIQRSPRVSLQSPQSINSHSCQSFLSESHLTLHPAEMPSPPAQTILSVTRMPHQLSCEQVSWSTTGRRTCCRTSACCPSAVDEDTCKNLYEPLRVHLSLFLTFDLSIQPKYVNMSSFPSLERRPQPVT